MKIVVAIATYRRKQSLNETLGQVAKQTRPPDRLIVCAPRMEDVDEDAVINKFGAELIISEPGTCRQRNRILDRLADEDIVIFFDDDFLAAADYLEELEKVFLEGEAKDDPIVVATGQLIADGIIGPGYTYEQTIEHLEKREEANLDRSVRSVHNGYGCNMAISLAAIRRDDLRFDERLAVYGWLEDVDFTRQLRRQGRIVKTGRLTGVHRGVKLGRSPGKPLGFSQVVNPAYIAKKGNISWFYASRSIIRRLGRNTIGLVVPDRLVDRPGRFYGNMIGLWYLLTGRFRPEEIKKM